MREINVKQLIEDYTINDYGLEAICKEYHIGKLKAKAILQANGIEIKKKGKQALNDDFVVKDFKLRKYVERNGYHYEAVDKVNGFKTKDYMNDAGVLTTHIKKEYGVEIPTLYDRRMYYMRTGNYWWEQWFNIIEVENPKVKKCPYCDWETKDIENKSGAFEVHLYSKHGITKQKYLEEFPEEREYFKLVCGTKDLQMETDENKFVVCEVCGKKLTRITDVHLSKHGLTKQEYMLKYGLSGTTCNALAETLRKNIIPINENMIHSFSSSQENEIKEYIKALGLQCETNRKILHGKELDIYVHSKNLAIEFNGNLWHSEKYGKDREYHLNKLEECNKQGVNLIQIFEDEYDEHKDIVFSKLRHILGCENLNGEKIQGRKCQIKEISIKDSEEFLNRNHIQGFVSSTIHIGAIYNGQLVAVMSFLREGDWWNLTRFASKNGSICQGVGGKLFKYFIKKYSPTHIKSFADRRWTINGENNLYIKLGFKLDEVLKPDYRYYNPKVDKVKRFHKFNFRKDILSRKYGFPKIMTETEMTKELGYTRIWDCGLFKYVWRKEE